MKAEETTKEPAVNFANFKDAPEAPMGYGQEISHVFMASGHVYEIVPKSFHLYKTKEGLPFVEFQVWSGPTGLNSGNRGDKAKTIQVFPAMIAGWAFDE